MQASLKIQRAQRLQALPPYLFAKIDELKQQALANGVDIIDLGVGDPDLATPETIVKSLQEAAADPANHHYPSYIGMPEFRQAAADWFKKRYNVQLDPGSEVITLIGSKEGIAHTPLAFVNPGESVLVPDPGYPVYQAATIMAGGIPRPMPLREENDFLPDLQAIDKNILAECKLMFLNYPNNPTAATADRDFFARLIDFAREHEIVICQDAAYAELAYDGYRPLSLLELEGGKEVGIEFHSLSKTFNMTGWRLGFAVGDSKLISALGAVKTNVDSGVFQAVQVAGINALQNYERYVPIFCETFRKRRDIMVIGLRKLGLAVVAPRATFYLWVKVPAGYTSTSFSMHLLKEAGIIATPGNGFGKFGEGFIRFALTVPAERLEEAVNRMRKVGF